ncbi:MAG: hypothetical protein H6669_15695 [Ardenticatenaceae bacterium]|nr:hypothetical protein [Ardenticatenaceae bacterium]
MCTDYQCPYCQRHARKPCRKSSSEMIDNSRVLRYQDFPLDSIHPYARDGLPAARAVPATRALT